MMLNSQLDAAADAGIIDTDQASKLKQFLAERLSLRGSPPETDRSDRVNDVEAVRFARGFHDVFLSIGLVILLVGVSIAANLALSTSDYGLIAGPGAFASAFLALLLAEYFTGGKRLVLPSIVLASTFCIALGEGVARIAPPLLIDSDTLNQSYNVNASYYALYGAFGALLASLLFFARHRLPFAAGLIAATASATALILLYIAAPDSFNRFLHPVLFIAGVTTFSAAMMLDATDPNRNTIRSDTAFWLHLAAAPMIVHAAIGHLVSDGVGRLTSADAALILLVIGALSVVALIIDRRAILVAGLVYFGIAVGVVAREAALEGGAVIAVALLVIGAAVVLLGTGWRSARAAVINSLLKESVARRLPPT